MELMDKFNISASMLLTGFAIVFGVLFLLILIIWIYGKIVSTAQLKAAKRKEERELAKREKEQSEAEMPQPKQSTAPVAVQPRNDNNEISDEVAAVISAAVYSMYGSKQKVKIKSVKRSSKRSVWAQAGIIENNQPFVGF